MLITSAGVLVRTEVEQIREMGRATQGVTLISCDDGDFLTGVKRVVESDLDDSDVLDEIEDIAEIDNDEIQERDDDPEVEE